MLKPVVLLASLILLVMSVSQIAYANHVGCNFNGGTHTSGTWKWMGHPNNGYNYTDWSDWSGPTFTARRIDSSGGTTFNDVATSYLIFDNGNFSPWRKTGMYNQSATQYTYFEQGNDNGSCS